MTTLSFHGAAGTVTGSKYLLNVNGAKILIDCGMFQGTPELRQRNWNPLPFDPSEVKAVVLTHAHIDHVGYLPRLVRAGFKGPVYCTAPTADIAAVSLEDTAHLQMEDAEFRNKKKLTRHGPALPLFTDSDVSAATELFRQTPFDSWFNVGDEYRFQYHVIGHILGAACIECEVKDQGRVARILFSGDVGRYHSPITKDPTTPPECDYLICESTYGGRLHPTEDPHEALAALINEAFKRRSMILIPAFAVGRTQQIMVLVDDLIQKHRIPPIDVYIDSPMAITATDIYTRYQVLHGLDSGRFNRKGSLFDGKHVHLCRTRKSSQELNDLGGPAIIVSASGMLTGGRILHHLIHRLPDPTAMVALVGYMAEGTLGRQLVEGAREVRIHKQPIKVAAKIVVFNGLSGHADYSEILRWLKPISVAPKQVFITHGELSQSEAMAGHVRNERGWKTLIPTLDQTVTL